MTAADGKTSVLTIRAVGGLFLILALTLGLVLYLRNPMSLWAVIALWSAAQFLDIVVSPSAWERGMQVRFAAQEAGFTSTQRHELQTLINPMKDIAIGAGGIVIATLGILQGRLWLLAIGSLIVAGFTCRIVLHLIRGRSEIFEAIRTRLDSLVGSELSDEERLHRAKTLLQIYREMMPNL